MKNKTQKKKFNWFIIFPVVAVISVCIYAYVNSLPASDTTRKAVEVYTKNGEKAEDYSTYKEFLQDVTAKDGMPNTIDADSTQILDNKPQTTKSYCGNKNSKVYHTISCTYSKNMNDENKVYFSTKSECDSNGYKPCSRCKP